MYRDAPEIGNACPGAPRAPALCPSRRSQLFKLNAGLRSNDHADGTHIDTSLSRPSRLGPRGFSDSSRPHACTP